MIVQQFHEVKPFDTLKFPIYKAVIQGGVFCMPINQHLTYTSSQKRVLLDPQYRENLLIREEPAADANFLTCVYASALVAELGFL